MVSKEIHKKILGLCLILLIALFISNTVIHIFYWANGWTEILWYCNLASLFLVFGIFFKKPLLNSIVLVTIIPVQFFWILDFFITLFGFQGFGRTALLFDLPFSIVAISSILHLTMIPIAIYAVVVYGFKKNSFVWILLSMFFVLILPYLFSPFVDNINCVFYPCDLAFEDLEGMQIDNFVPGSWSYLVFVALRWFGWFFVFYFGILMLLQRVFKKVKIV